MRAYGSKLGLILLFAGAVALAQRRSPRSRNPPAAAAPARHGPGHRSWVVAWVRDVARMPPRRSNLDRDPWEAAWAAGGRIPTWWRSWA